MDRPLRILLLNSARRWIGEAAHTLALAEALQARGHRVILGVRQGFELEERAQGRDLTLLPLAFNSRFSLFDDLRDLWRVRRVLASERIDLIHCHRGKDHWLAAAARTGRGRSVALVRTRHVVTPARGHLPNRWLYGCATQGVIAVSSAARASLGGLIDGLDPSCARVILSSVDSVTFHPKQRSEAVRRELGAGEQTVLIGLIGRLQRVKGQRYFLQAAAQLAARHPDVRFLLAGRGSEGQRQALWQTADALGLPRERLRIDGILANLPDVMAALDIGVVASVGSEGSSRVTLEYMASGLPVVATRVGGIPEILNEGEEGLLVAPRDADGLAGALERLISDAALRSAMGQAGRRSVEAHFRPERWVEEVEGLYRAVRERTGASGRG